MQYCNIAGTVLTIIQIVSKIILPNLKHLCMDTDYMRDKD